jgi:hypothetical protein
MQQLAGFTTAAGRGLGSTFQDWFVRVHRAVTNEFYEATSDRDVRQQEV